MALQETQTKLFDLILEFSQKVEDLAQAADLDIDTVGLVIVQSEKGFPLMLHGTTLPPDQLLLALQDMINHVTEEQGRQAPSQPFPTGEGL